MGYRLGPIGLEIAADHRSHHREFASGVVFKASGPRVAARALCYFRGGAAEPESFTMTGWVAVGREW